MSEKALDSQLRRRGSNLRHTDYDSGVRQSSRGPAKSCARAQRKKEAGAGAPAETRRLRGALRKLLLLLLRLFGMSKGGRFDRDEHEAHSSQQCSDRTQ